MLCLAQIFEVMEEHKAKLGVVNYAASQPTLETIFLAICSKAQPPPAAAAAAAAAAASAASDAAAAAAAAATAAAAAPPGHVMISVVCPASSAAGDLIQVRHEGASAAPARSYPWPRPWEP